MALEEHDFASVFAAAVITDNISSVPVKSKILQRISR
jgi:hypothetical protein